MTAGCLLDTNILLCLANSRAPGHAAAKSAVGRLLASGERLAVAPQVLFEFRSVATRPVHVNGLGMTAAQTLAEVEAIRARFLLLAEPLIVVDFWLSIVASHDLKGRRIHDAHLLATMKANGVARLLTFNAGDFPQEPGVAILTPQGL